MSTTVKRETIKSYMDCLSRKCVVPVAKKQKRVAKDDLTVPTIKNYSMSMANNLYSLDHLKHFVAFYGLKKKGNKSELARRIYEHLHFKSRAVKIQATFRMYLVKRYLELHGPARNNRTLCNNSDDFVTMDALSEIDFHHFISYTDEDGFVYGFHIASLHNLLLKTTTELRNPYTRKRLPMEVFKAIRAIMRISKMLDIPLQLAFEDTTVRMTTEQMVTNRAVGMFQHINMLGHYADVQWFLSLSHEKLCTFLYELEDIWEYRAGLSEQTRIDMSPDNNGHPFRELSHDIEMMGDNIHHLRMYVMKVIDTVIVRSSPVDFQTLGAYYVLCALTLVSPAAADAMPWLFEAVRGNEMERTNS